jgi:hypothetical protein
LKDLRLKKKFWELQVRRWKGLKVDTKYMRRVKKAAGLSSVLVTSLDQALHERREAYLKLKKFDDVANRKTWLQEVADARAEANDTKAETEYKTLLRHEQQRRDSRMTKRA